MATKARQIYTADEETLHKDKRTLEIESGYKTKIDGIEDGAQVNVIEGVKVNGTKLTPDAQKNVNVEVPIVVDNVYTADSEKALSANMGKQLSQEIENLKSRGRFLSFWNAVAGRPTSEPPQSPYTYHTGDYFIVDSVATAGGTNYRPEGTSYTTGDVSTTVETELIVRGSMYIFDGTDWLLQAGGGGGGGTAQWGQIVGTLSNQTDLKGVLDSKITNPASGTAGQVLTKTASGEAWQDVDGLPSQTGKSGKFLTTDGTDASWEDIPEELPSGGTAGQVLTKTASGTAWDDVDGLPDQTGKNGKYLKTNGTSASWEDAGDMKYADFEFSEKAGTTLTLGLSSLVKPISDFTVNAPTTIKDGQVYILRVENDGVAYSMTLGTNITDPYEVDYTLTDNATDQFVFLGVGGKLELQPLAVLPEDIPEVPVEDVKVNGTSVVTNKVANIDLSGKQDVLTAGHNVTISGTTINAVDELPALGEVGEVLTVTGGIDAWGPMEEGYHIPTKDEWVAVKNAGVTLGAWSSGGGDDFRIKMKLPFAGRRSRTSSSIDIQGSNACYWSSTAYGTNNAYYLYAGSSTLNPQDLFYRTYGYSIRAFKNTPVVPDSNWTVITQGTGTAGIYHNSTLGLISISSDGTTWYTLQDKNLGATQVYNDGDTLSQANCGYYYQWGNCYGFPYTGTVTTSSTQVDASGYGKGNLYSSSTFITDSYDWSSVQNDNLRGTIISPRQASWEPVPEGLMKMYTVSSTSETSKFEQIVNDINNGKFVTIRWTKDNYDVMLYPTSLLFDSDGYVFTNLKHIDAEGDDGTKRIYLELTLDIETKEFSYSRYEERTEKYLPNGGTTGQVLTKTSSGEAWQNISGGDMQYSDFEFSQPTGNAITLTLSTEITPSANFTVNAPSTVKEGQAYILRVTNGATPVTMTLGTGIENPSEVDLTLTANAIDQFAFLGLSDGTLELQPGGGGGDSLPDQTGNAGKFLQTNGTEASWKDVNEFMTQDDYDTNHQASWDTDHITRYIYEEEEEEES